VAKTDANKADANKTGQRASLVIAGTGVLWVIGLLVGRAVGLETRFLALIDLAALAGFVWALWLIYQTWRARQNNQGH